jgi:hypothetical protein
MRSLDDADETTGCTSREHVRLPTNRAGRRRRPGAFVQGSKRRIDLAGVDGRVFVNNASLRVCEDRPVG